MLLLTSCGGKQKTERGTAYVYRIDNKGAKAKPNDVIEFHLDVYNDKDSLISSTHEKNEPFIHKLSNDKQLSALEDAIKLCGSGDSITFYLSSDSLPQGFIDAPAGVVLRFEMKVEKVQSEADFLAEQEAKAQKIREEEAAKAQKIREEEAIEEEKREQRRQNGLKEIAAIIDNLVQNQQTTLNQSSYTGRLDDSYWIFRQDAHVQYDRDNPLRNVPNTGRIKITKSGYFISLEGYYTIEIIKGMAIINIKMANDPYQNLYREELNVLNYNGTQLFIDKWNNLRALNGNVILTSNN
jgi:FKBP-type peptidyl-prolyl cis-trans isomerase 2